MTFLTQGKTNVKYLFVVIILAILAGGLMVGISKITECPCWWPSSQPQQALPIDETADWQTYRNEEYGFEIKYPQVWYLEERKGINVSPPYINIMEVVLNEKKIDKKEQSFISVNIQDPDYVSEPKDWKDFELGQINGEISCSAGVGCEILIWSNNYQDFHIITTNSPLEDKLTSQMLSTFKFLEQQSEEGICKNQCGDGTCQEIVCLATGCPCPETKESCPQDCEIKDETADWQTYRNEEYGFEIKHPKDVVISNNCVWGYKDEGCINMSIPSIGDLYIYIYDSNKPYIWEPRTDHNLGIKEMTINGIEFEEYYAGLERSGMQTCAFSLNYVTKRNNKNYHLEFYYGSECYVPDEKADERKEIFYQMINTFKFLD